MDECTLYKQLYHLLFNGITDALNGPPTWAHAVEQLRALQCAAEALYCDASYSSSDMPKW